MSVKERRGRWSLALMQIYQKYPAAFRSKEWAQIKQLVADGEVVDAQAIAKAHEGEHKSNRAENVIARRIRVQRVQLFKVQRDHLTKIKDAFFNAGNRIAHRMIHLPNTVSSIAPLRVTTRETLVELRRALNTLLTDLIWQSIILGVKNMGEAIKPILRDNQEAFTEELEDVALIEERLTIGLSKQLAAKGKGHVAMNSQKWQDTLDRIYNEIVKKNNTGLTLSERIWDLTNRAEQDLKRIIASDIASGESSRDIADKIQKYIYTSGIDEDYQSGPGIYKSPLKNAMRLARTETNRAYASATAAWADSKAWVKGIRVTLSPAHDKEDECDDVVNDQPDDGYPPDEFAGVVPVHPHCMCFGSYVIDENYLTDQAAGPSEEETPE